MHETPPTAIAERLWPRSHGRVHLGKDARVVEVNFTADRADRIGEIKGEVLVQTHVKRFEKIRVPVTGRVVPPVSAVPSLVSFGEVDVDSAIERSLLLTSALAKPFKILAVTPEVAGLKWSATPRDGGVELRLAAASVAAHKLSGSSLTVKVEHAGDWFDLEIPVFAAKKPAP